MCGIVGYIGSDDARRIVLSGLEKLEYRGYDSAGIAMINNNDDSFNIYKEKGRVDELKKLIDYNIPTSLSIGHTRWATHGEPTKDNAHPHISNNKRFILVHNGVINNYKRLKYEYLSNYKFYSKTDTEIIVNLIEFFSEELTICEAIRKTMTLLEGSYAVLLIDVFDKNKIYFFSNKNKIVLGKTNSGYIIASDLLPFIGISNNYIEVDDYNLGYISKDNYEIMDIFGNSIKKEFNTIKLTEDEISKGSYQHYMLKEIFDSPQVLKNLIDNYFVNNDIVISNSIIKILKDSDQINIVASGSSLYAGYMTKYFFEKQCKIPTELFCASELVYSSPLITKKPVFLFLSQSGETADSISVINKYKGIYPIISMTNNDSSTIKRLSDYHLYLYAGTEIAVASTKSYLAQVTLSAILAFCVAEKENELKNELLNTLQAILEVLDNKDSYLGIAKEIYRSNNLFYVGRGIDYWVALEAALKLKEVSYIHSEAYPSGELKHGPIALIEEGTPIIAIITQEGTNPIVRVNLKEAKARKAKIYIISMKSLSSFDDDISIPNVVHYLSPLVTSIVVQLIAYYTALLKGNDIDKPKNLAKCVTVE